MADEAVTTLHAELVRFGEAEEGIALLETFLEVAGPWLGPVVLDPRELWLPHELTADRAVVQGLIEEINSAVEPKRGLLTVAERTFDMADEQARWDFTRLAYCSSAATVWSRGRRTTFFEHHRSGAQHDSASYWLPDSVKAAYFEGIAAKGWEVPAGWLGAVAKRPKPWWRRF